MPSSFVRTFADPDELTEAVRVAAVEFTGMERGIEISPNFGDELRVQAATVREAGLSTTSIPSVNLTP